MLQFHLLIDFPRVVWCYACMFISLIINLFMMITWSAKVSMADLEHWDDGVEFPPELYEYVYCFSTVFFNKVLHLSLNASSQQLLLCRTVRQEFQLSLA